MNELEYVVREIDLIAFNEHEMRKSGDMQRTLNKQRLIYPSVLALVALFFAFYYQDVKTASYVAVTAVIWALFFPAALKWGFKRRIRKLYTPEQKKQILGLVKLRIDPSALHESHHNKKTDIEWESILRVEQTETHALIFVELNEALIIPRETITEGDLDQFVLEACKRIDQAEQA